MTYHTGYSKRDSGFCIVINPAILNIVPVTCSQVLTILCLPSLPFAHLAVPRFRYLFDSGFVKTSCLI